MYCLQIMMEIMFYLPALLKDQQKQVEALADKYDIKLNKHIDDIKTESLEDLLETLKKDGEETEELSKLEKAKCNQFEILLLYMCLAASLCSRGGSNVLALGLERKCGNNKQTFSAVLGRGLADQLVVADGVVADLEDFPGFEEPTTSARLEVPQTKKPRAGDLDDAGRETNNVGRGSTEVEGSTLTAKRPSGSTGKVETPKWSAECIQLILSPAALAMLTMAKKRGLISSEKEICNSSPL
uniref:Uncharacterized protein n=1 Tax=Glossina pallidipes TaxID=7398 RepID=A0A1B0A8W1_GLOPL